MHAMGASRKVASSGAWVWRRIADLSTLQWLWPWLVTISTVAVALTEDLPLALLLVLAVGAFAFTLVAVLLIKEIRSGATVPKGAVVLTDAAEAEIVKPVPLSTEEKLEARDALARVRSFIDQRLAQLQHDAQRIGREGYQARADELPPFQDRANALKNELAHVLSQNAYGLGLAKVVFDGRFTKPLGTVGVRARKLGEHLIAPASDDEGLSRAIAHERNEAVRANNELEAAIDQARRDIDAARRKLER